MASTYLDTIDGHHFRFPKGASLNSAARQADAVGATGAPCDSNYRHARLFFSPHFLINHPAQQ